MANVDLGNHRPEPLADFDTRFVIEVRNRFDGSWSEGFEVVEIIDHDADDGPRCCLRRLSDGYVLPALFSAEDLIVGVRGRDKPTP